VVVDSFPAYWGDTAKAVSSQCTPKFVQYDANSRAWDDRALQTELCALIDQTGARIIFTHSFSGPVFAAAIMNKIGACSRFVPWSSGGKIPAGKLAWVLIQPPMGPSPAADVCIHVCAATGGVLGAIKNAGKAVLDFFAGGAKKAENDLKQVALDAAGKVSFSRNECACTSTSQTTPGKAVYSVTTPSHSAAQFNQLASIAHDYAWRHLCGISPDPAGIKLVNSFFMPILKLAIQFVQGYGVDGKTHMGAPIHGNDGFVNWGTCHGNHADSEWSTVHTARLYYGRMNHGDGTGRAGDGSTEDKKPVQFMIDAARDLASRLQ